MCYGLNDLRNKINNPQSRSRCQVIFPSRAAPPPRPCAFAPSYILRLGFARGTYPLTPFLRGRGHGERFCEGMA